MHLVQHGLWPTTLRSYPEPFPEDPGDRRPGVHDRVPNKEFRKSRPSRHRRLETLPHSRARQACVH